MERQRDNRWRRPSAPSVFDPIAGRSRGEDAGESQQREPLRAAPAKISRRPRLLQQLQSHSTLRQAMLLREIIGPPKALQGPAVALHLLSHWSHQSLCYTLGAEHPSGGHNGWLEPPW